MSESLVGTIVDDVVLHVEPGKLREMVKATQASDPVHTDPEAAAAAGFRALPATATYVVVAGHQRDPRAFTAKLGLAMERIVVGEVSWVYERPLVVGDEIRGTRTVVGDIVRPGKRGGQMRIVTLETPYTDAEGVVVVRQTETLIEREVSA